ncbi:MAG: type I restriction-modification system subunit M [Deltaproteobacteria bacterium]|jgi:type I restriction enzyme M protein|nr:type I restriction-modification system subunit M [Deltaproteobacteria bacterium]
MNGDRLSKLNRLADTFLTGGMVDPVSNIEQVSYLLFLKLLDGEESSLIKSLYPRQAEGFRWSRWCTRSGPDLLDFVRDQVFPYMASLAEAAPRIAGYFCGAWLEINDPNVLKQVVDRIEDLNLTEPDLDFKSDILEYLMDRLWPEASLNAQFRTPRQIRLLMVEMLAPEIGETVCDPACGTGGLLSEAVNYILAKNAAGIQEIPIYGEDWLDKRGQSVSEAKKEFPAMQTYRKAVGEKSDDVKRLEQSVYGFDISRRMIRLAELNLRLHGLRRANVSTANVLSEIGGLSAEDLARRYQVIISNPPTSGLVVRDSIRRDISGYSPKNDLFFLILMMKSLAPGGRCAVTVPEVILSSSQVTSVAIRRELANDFDLLAVISLPQALLSSYTAARVVLLVFRRPNSGEGKDILSKRKEKVWFYEVQADGFDPEKSSASSRLLTPQDNDIPDLLDKWKAYKETNFLNPPGAETGTALEPGSQEVRSWWTTVEGLSQNDYILVPNRYRPKTGREVRDGEVERLIEENLLLEMEIAAGLKRLLKEVVSV